ncbi:YkgJ family cysteine cluster protein [Clostridium sp. AM58-1XD]|uniref:YkgJ family cysteine cluster protein n=1 Tax=Clostridium sp. AM58-1XD TaxID=2292307 RepID=UPI001FA8FF56|nr:YkgJ family cysteine cluster protein [Clostridium sp. AM58-1XD]
MEYLNNGGGMTSDERFYGLNDMVKAGCGDCEGCSACCRGMGASIVLNPYDIWLLTSNLKTSFEGLMAGKIELNVVNGIILPNLKMVKNEERCAFLNEENRCGIHSFRPGICRIFPLGRDYGGRGIRYFLLDGACRKENKTKVKVRRWIDTENVGRNEEFLVSWHSFLKGLQAQIMQSGDETWVKNANMYVLRKFYLQPYDREADFYGQFYTRLKKAKEELEVKGDSGLGISVEPDLGKETD